MASNVFLYALSTCGHCRRTKQLLNDSGITYDYVDVDKCEGEERAQMIEEVKKYNPQCTFPTLLIDDVVVVGYKEDEIKKALDIK